MRAADLGPVSATEPRIPPAGRTLRAPGGIRAPRDIRPHHGFSQRRERSARPFVLSRGTAGGGGTAILTPTWHEALTSLVTLPGLAIIVLLLGLLVHVKKPWLGLVVIWAGVLFLLTASVPISAYRFISPLQRYPALPVSVSVTATGPRAIVILGAGRYADAPEYGEDTVGAYGLERLRYGARLYR